MDKPKQETENKESTNELIDGANNINYQTTLFSELTYNEELEIVQCKFAGQNNWHLATRQNLFWTRGKTVETILEKNCI